MKAMRVKARKTFGVGLVILGFLALLTPLTPGAWLVPIGFGILGIRSERLDRLIARFVRKK